MQTEWLCTYQKNLSVWRRVAMRGLNQRFLRRLGWYIPPITNQPLWVQFQTIVFLILPPLVQQGFVGFVPFLFFDPCQNTLCVTWSRLCLKLKQLSACVCLSPLSSPAKNMILCPHIIVPNESPFLCSSTSSLHSSTMLRSSGMSSNAGNFFAGPSACNKGWVDTSKQTQPSLPPPLWFPSVASSSFEHASLLAVSSFLQHRCHDSKQVQTMRAHTFFLVFKCLRRCLRNLWWCCCLSRLCWHVITHVWW